MHDSQHPLRPGVRQIFLAIGIVLAALTPTRAIDPPPVVFEGLGLAGFTGAGSVAAALRQVNTTATKPTDIPLTFQGINVRGPSGPNAAPAPLTAELRSRIDRIEVAAGLLADPAVIQSGPSQWTGRIGLAHDGAAGRESLEVRTMLAPGVEQSLVGVAVGPRLERRLRKGTLFFIDGQAEAQAFHSQESNWWMMPGTSRENYSMLGLTARTGIVR
jgi:hypothetical protein